MANTLVMEQQLTRVVRRCEGKALDPDKNSKYLPRPSESPFGDFPASHKAKKNAAPAPKPLAAQEQSVANAVTMKSK